MVIVGRAGHVAAVHVATAYVETDVVWLPEKNAAA